MYILHFHVYKLDHIVGYGGVAIVSHQSMNIKIFNSSNFAIILIAGWIITLLTFRLCTVIGAVYSTTNVCLEVVCPSIEI